MLTEAFAEPREQLRDRDAARGARLARDHVQRGDHPGAPVRRHRGTRASSSNGSTRWLSEADRRHAAPSRRGRATPTRRGLRRARRRARLLRGLRRGRADGPAAADVVDHPLAPLEDADPVPRAPLPRRHVRRARQRPLGPARRPTAYAEREFAADALAVLDATGTERAVLVVALARRAASAAPRRRAPGAGRRRRLHRPGAAARRGARRCRSARPLWDDELDTDEGWAKYNAPLLAARLPRLPRVLLLADASPSRTRRSRSRTASAGGSRPTAETLDRDARARRRSDEDAQRGSARTRSLPGARDPRRRRRDHPLRRGIALAEQTGGELVLLEGSGHGPHVRDPVKVNLLLRDFVEAGAACAPLGARQVAAASARSTSPRRSGSATRSATSRSPKSCASSTRTSRSTGSPSIR